LKDQDKTKEQLINELAELRQVITMEKDWDRLLQRVCDTLMETRGYYNAWIALFDESRRLVTTAEAGLGKDFLPMVEMLNSGELPYCGQMALAQTDVVAIEDPSATCTDCPLSGKYHGRSGMSVRLKNGGKIYGFLTVSIPKNLVADEEEQTLFKEVASDIALALNSIELKEQHKHAEEELRESVEKYRTLFEDSRDAIYITTRNGLFIDANQSFFGLFGYTREEIGGINARQLYVNPDDGHRFREEIEQKGYVKDFEVKMKKKDGTGMEETRSHIFEPFFTTKEVGKGTGLGLATVYGIVKQSGGYIWVYSEPGQGTTFKIYLPAVERETVQGKKEQTSADDLTGSETILIAEDDDALRNLAREILQQQGYRILEAENGIEALRISEEHGGQIHLMITDVVMPKMGGKEVADRLQPLYPQMKVIYMSGYTDNSIAHHGILAPGLNFLEKPFTPEGLARKVRKVLDKKQE